MATQPNILFLMVDQMSHFVLPVAQPNGRQPRATAIAPNLKALANEGRVFTNCYSASPLCAPARASILTGAHVREHRVCTNGDEFPASMPTFLHGLQKEGYRTTVSGKTHFIGPDQLHGFDDRLTTDIYPSDFVWSRDWDKPVSHDPGTSVDKLSQSGVCRTNMQINYDTEASNRAVEFLQEHALDGAAQPFFLMLSLTQPHEPFETLQAYWDLYDDVEIQCPDAALGGAPDKHPYDRMLDVYHGLDRNAPDAERIRTSIRAHLGMITHVDDYVGRVLNTLDTLGMRDDTIIVFTSDHGEMLGEHGMWFKRTYFEESAHVPLIVSWPGHIPTGVTEDIVSHVDLAPTFLDLVGAEPRQFGVGSQSLGTMLRTGADAQWRSHARIDYLGDGTNKPMFMLREGDWKLAYFPDFRPVLFNLAQDPYETTDLAGQPEHADRIAAMTRIIVGDLDVAGFVEAIKAMQKDRIFIQTARQAASAQPWDYQPFRDATRQYVRAAVNHSTSR